MTWYAKPVGEHKRNLDKVGCPRCGAKACRPDHQPPRLSRFYHNTIVVDVKCKRCRFDYQEIFTLTGAQECEDDLETTYL